MVGVERMWFHGMGRSFYVGRWRCSFNAGLVWEKEKRKSEGINTILRTRKVLEDRKKKNARGKLFGWRETVLPGSRFFCNCSYIISCGSMIWRKLSGSFGSHALNAVQKTLNGFSWSTFLTSFITTCVISWVCGFEPPGFLRNYRSKLSINLSIFILVFSRVGCRVPLLQSET